MYSQSRFSLKAQKCINFDINQFHQRRVSNKCLQHMRVQDYHDYNYLSDSFKKMLVIYGNQRPYINKIINIRIQFDRNYPEEPLRMFVQPSKGVNFLHANVYNDLGDICHPILQKSTTMGQRKFSDILIHISELIFKPNFEDAANLTLCNLYKNNIDEYERVIEENVALLEDVPVEERSDSDSSEENDSS